MAIAGLPVKSKAWLPAFFLKLSTHSIIGFIGSIVLSIKEKASSADAVGLILNLSRIFFIVAVGLLLVKGLNVSTSAVNPAVVTPAMSLAIVADALNPPAVLSKSPLLFCGKA